MKIITQEEFNTILQEHAELQLDRERLQKEVKVLQEDKDKLISQDLELQAQFTILKRLVDSFYKVYIKKCEE